jgi:hypothetical protein
MEDKGEQVRVTHARGAFFRMAATVRVPARAHLVFRSTSHVATATLSGGTRAYGSPARPQASTETALKITERHER